MNTHFLFDCNFLSTYKMGNCHTLADFQKQSRLARIASETFAECTELLRINRQEAKQKCRQAPFLILSGRSVGGAGAFLAGISSSSFLSVSSSVWQQQWIHLFASASRPSEKKTRSVDDILFFFIHSSSCVKILVSNGARVNWWRFVKRHAACESRAVGDDLFPKVRCPAD